jgi:hypothetical protein
MRSLEKSIDVAPFEPFAILGSTPCSVSGLFSYLTEGTFALKRSSGTRPK